MKGFAIGARHAGLLRAACAVLVLLAATAAQAQNRAADRQQEARLAYLRDMPSPEQVIAAFDGPTPAQAMGRQCAALSLLFRGRMFPDMSFSKPGVELAERYRAAAAGIERRYSATVKSLDEVENRREWTRMCENRRSGLNPLSGKAEAGFPALAQPVTLDELMPLFRPTVRAALDRVAAENKQLAASQQARNAAMLQQAEAANARAARERTTQLLLSVAGTLAILALVALLVWIARATARIGARPGAQGEVLVNGRPYRITQFGGRLLQGRKERETITQRIRSTDPAQPDRHSTVTIVHDHLRVEDTQGHVRDLHLRNWDLRYSDGDTLQFYRLAQGEQADAEFAVIANRSTGTHQADHDTLARKAAPVHGLLAILLVVAAGFCSFGIGWIVGGLWIFYSSRRMRRVEDEVARWLAAYEPLAPLPSLVSPASPVGRAP